MKLLKILLLNIVLMCLLFNKDVRAQPVTTISFQIFYDNLAPYGQWISDDQYGYVWVPDADYDFHPYYSNGYWAMTEYGNTWISNYSWGWAPFHYGRWTFDPYYGWVWIPGYQWGPAWVCWRSGNGYYGWTPLSPGFEIGVSIINYNCPYDWWIFIPAEHIHNHHFHHYSYGPRKNRKIIEHTAIIDRSKQNALDQPRYIPGPDVPQIENETKQHVTQYHLDQSNAPGEVRMDGNAIKLFHPMTATNRADAAPPKLITAPQHISAPKPVNSAQPFRDIFRSDDNRFHDRGFQPARPSGSQNQGNPSPGDRPMRDRPTREQPAPRQDVTPRQSPTRPSNTNPTPPPVKRENTPRR